MNALHITNGDSAGDTLKACGIGGDVLPWRDPMHHGPFPPDLDLDAVSAVRARYLEGPPTDGTAPHVFQRRNELLRAACEYDEVILWFEHDLHDQVQILQLLDWFSTASMGSTKLTIICIDRFEGIDPFRGLGQLNPAQTASLLASRQSVTGAQMTLARQGWAAFRSPDPTILHAFLGGDLTPLPFLAAALARHLEEFPWWKDGLSRSERQILTLAADGIAAPGRLFVANMARETCLFEGDLRSYQHIAELCGASPPLLHSEPYGTFRLPSDRTLSRSEFLGQRLTLTITGKQVLAGETDAWHLMPRDAWLGGVRLLTGQPMWAWDADAAGLRLRWPDNAPAPEVSC